MRESNCHWKRRCRRHTDPLSLPISFSLSFCRSSPGAFLMLNVLFCLYVWKSTGGCESARADSGIRDTLVDAAQWGRELFSNAKRFSLFSLSRVLSLSLSLSLLLQPRACSPLRLFPLIARSQRQLGARSAPNRVFSENNVNRYKSTVVFVNKVIKRRVTSLIPLFLCGLLRDRVSWMEKFFFQFLGILFVRKRILFWKFSKFFKR